MTLLGSLVGFGAAAALVTVGTYWFWVIGGSVSFLSACVALYAASVMTEPARVKIVDRTRCVARVRFRNAEYGRMLAEHLRGSSKSV
jgi:hypothetical protein